MELLENSAVFCVSNCSSVKNLIKYVTELLSMEVIKTRRAVLKGISKIASLFKYSEAERFIFAQEI